jgi:flagellar protein FliS
LAIRYACRKPLAVVPQSFNPGHIILMLYDGALRALENALPGFSTKDPAQANMLVHNNLQHARDIIHQLSNALNMEKGGECATTFRRLYNYFDRLIWQSDIRKRRDGVDEVIRHLTVLRDAWATMLQNQSVPGSSLLPQPAASLNP